MEANICPVILGVHPTLTPATCLLGFTWLEKFRSRPFSAMSAPQPDKDRDSLRLRASVLTDSPSRVSVLLKKVSKCRRNLRFWASGSASRWCFCSCFCCCFLNIHHEFLSRGHCTFAWGPRVPGWLWRATHAGFKECALCSTSPSVNWNLAPAPWKRSGTSDRKPLLPPRMLTAPDPSPPSCRPPAAHPQLSQNNPNPNYYFFRDKIRQRQRAWVWDEWGWNVAESSRSQPWTSG